MNSIIKIGFTGTQSCGKSTLVKALAELPQFSDFHIATERSKYLSDLGIPLNQESTMYGQTLFLNERLGELQYNNLLTDRTIIDVMAFTSLSPIINDFDKNRFEVFAAPFIKQYTHIFYIPPEIPLENNGVRDISLEFREAIDNKIKHYIEHYKFRIFNFHQISGTVEERIQQVLNIINF